MNYRQCPPTFWFAPSQLRWAAAAATIETIFSSCKSKHYFNGINYLKFIFYKKVFNRHIIGVDNCDNFLKKYLLFKLSAFTNCFSTIIFRVNVWCPKWDKFLSKFVEKCFCWKLKWIINFFDVENWVVQCWKSFDKNWKLLVERTGRNFCVDKGNVINIYPHLRVHNFVLFSFFRE